MTESKVAPAPQTPGFPRGLCGTCPGTKVALISDVQYSTLRPNADTSLILQGTRHCYTKATDAPHTPLLLLGLEIWASPIEAQCRQPARGLHTARQARRHARVVTASSALESLHSPSVDR